MISELFGKTTGFSKSLPKPMSETIVITFDINGIAFSYLLVVFKKLCHSHKLSNKTGMTPCKTLTLTKP